MAEYHDKRKTSIMAVGCLRPRAADQIRRLYKGISGFTTQGEGPGGWRLRHAKARVYGELTAIGVRQLIAAAGIVPGARFVDLGSGVGKVVLHVALSVEGVTCVGIEIAGNRHRSACVALQQAEERGMIAAGRCVFRHQDLLDADLRGATVLFANSTCFPQKLLNRVARRVADLPGPLTFVTLHRLSPRLAARFHAVTTHDCHTSWSSHVAMHVYRLNHADDGCSRPGL